MIEEPETPRLFVIYWVVPCPDCDATALQPCIEDGQQAEEDVHLGRYQLFANARFAYPELGLKALVSVLPGEHQP